METSAASGGSSANKSPLSGNGNTIKSAQSQGISQPNSDQDAHDNTVIQGDDKVVHIQSIDLKKGLPPLESDAHKMPRTESGVVLDHDFYNIPEGGTQEGQYDDVSFNNLDIPEAGDRGSEVPEADKEKLPSIQEQMLPQMNRGVSCDNVLCENNGTCAVIESKAVCLCPLGTAGEYCERGKENPSPVFLSVDVVEVWKLLLTIVVLCASYGEE